MGKFKSKSRKKRAIKKGKIKGAPIWASIRKTNLMRSRTRRIRVDKRKHWRRDSKNKV